jgi:imidazole glycerol-phosphate synthase subunit HisH
MITIINYGSGNVKAIGNIYERLKIPFKVADTPEQVKDAEKIILPGVGAFDETISMLDQTGFRPVLDDKVLNGETPVLGICVGMQILSEKSEEGTLAGLGWIKGAVKKFDINLFKTKPALPHLGWNSISVNRKHHILDGIDEEDGFYFLHSFYFECANEEDILTTTFYGKKYASAVNRKNIFGAQFHPEKSHHNGVQLLKNFANL